MKDTFYFSHDYSARNDEKIRDLMREHGMLGYGVFWAIVEELYHNTNVLRTYYKGIAYDLRIDENLVKSVVEDFGLFVINGEYFSSNSIQRRLDDRGAKSAKARDSINKRWKEKNNKNTNVSKNDTNVLKNDTIKERKGKERKESGKEEISPANSPLDLSNSNLYRQPKIPLPEEVQMCFTKNGGTKEMADKFYEVNQSTGWFYKSSPITNFRNMVPGYIRAWTENEAKRPPPQTRKESKTMTQEEFLKTFDT